MTLWFLLLLICRCLSQKQVWEKIFLPASPARQNTDSPKASPWESSQPGKIKLAQEETLEAHTMDRQNFQVYCHPVRTFLSSPKEYVLPLPSFLTLGNGNRSFQTSRWLDIGFLSLACPQECSELTQPFTCSFLICFTDTMRRVGR